MMAGSEVLSARVEDGVAVITLGSPTRIFFDPEMSDALLEAMTAFASDDAVRVVASIFSSRARPSAINVSAM